MEVVERGVRVPGEVALEGILHLPVGAAPRAGVAVCHPHPLYGGNMHYPVVASLAREAARHGLAALRFNFRGTGRSDGEYGGGLAEANDLGTALTWLAEHLGPRAPLGAAGYSFGAAVAVAYATGAGRGPALRALALVGLPLGFPNMDWCDLSALAGSDLPVLAVVGQEDQFAPPTLVGRALAPLGPRAKLLLVPSADHSYEGRRAAVATFLADKLRGTDEQ